MPNKLNSTQNIVKKTILLFVFFMFVVFIFQLMNATKQYDDFIEYHKFLSSHSTTNAAVEINQYLHEKKRLVILFVSDNLDLIKKLSDDPDVDSHNYIELSKNIDRNFPENFAFTITDNKGKPYIIDFDGKIGDICLSDLNIFLLDNILLTRVHPNNIAYHFDIVTRWTAGNKTGIFFLSFRTKSLGQLINLVQVPQHNIFSINVERNNLIEITKDGSRINWDRNDYRLTSDELENTLIKIEVPNTRWHMIDLVDENLFSDFLFDLILKHGLVYLILLIIASVIIFILRKNLSELQLKEVT